MQSRFCCQRVPRSLQYSGVCSTAREYSSGNALVPRWILKAGWQSSRRLLNYLISSRCPWRSRSVSVCFALTCFHTRVLQCACIMCMQSSDVLLTLLIQVAYGKNDFSGANTLLPMLKVDPHIQHRRVFNPWSPSIPAPNSNHLCLHSSCCCAPQLALVKLPSLPPSVASSPTAAQELLLASTDGWIDGDGWNSLCASHPLPSPWTPRTATASYSSDSAACSCARLSLADSLTLPLSLSFSLPPSLTPSPSASPSLPLPLFLPLSLCLSLSLPLPLPLPLPPSLPLSLPLSPLLSPSAVAVVGPVHEWMLDLLSELVQVCCLEHGNSRACTRTHARPQETCWSMRCC